MMTDVEFKQNIRYAVRKKKGEFNGVVRGRVACKFYMQALKNLMEIHPELTNDVVERYIRVNPNSLKPLNDLLDWWDDAIDKVRNEPVDELFYDFYQSRKDGVYLKRVGQSNKNL